MCQLTLLHGKTNLVKSMLGNLTLMNSTGNRDGHGVYFPSPIKKLYKSKLDGGELVFNNEYWELMDKAIGDLDEICLMSHVRSASQTQKIINIENAHPHRAGSIILMHNGTLEPDDEKYEIENRIDSYWFTKRLADIVGRKHLRPAHIAETMEDFRGKFAFLIADTKQPKIIYVVRGKMADLSYTNYYDKDGKNICFAINTEKKSLSKMILPLFWRSILGEELIIDKPKEIDEESISIYDIPSGTLVKTDQKIEERTIYSKNSTTTVNRGTNWQQQQRNRNAWKNSRTRNNISAASSDKMAYNVSTLARDMVLSFSELNYIYFLMFGHSILFIDGENLRILEEFLKKLKKTYEGQGKGKKEKLWRQVYYSYSDKVENPVYLDIYNIADKTKFPWFFNANSGLKKYVHPRVKEWNPDGQKIS